MSKKKPNQKKIDRILGRLNKELGDNELREYLVSKNETSFNDKVTEEKTLVDFKKPIADPRVLLIAPPITIPRYMQKRCIPPLGISYVAAYLRKSGIKVDIIDCCVEGWEQEKIEGNLVTYGIPPSAIKDRLIANQYDVVGLSVLFSTDLPNLYETAQVVKDTLPDSTIVVGGLHPTIYPKEIFQLDVEYNDRRTIDFIIRGEGEHRLTNFINLLKQGKVNTAADGLVGFTSDDEESYIFNHQRHVIEDIDELPFPAFDLLDIEKYFTINIPFSPVPQGERVLPMLTTRGCPIGCSFCANTNTWKKHRKRSVENIVEELSVWKEKYNIDEVQFADDNLTFDMKHAIQKFNGMAHLNLMWCTPNGTMIDKLTPELLESMANSGMYQITLSLDSANARTLKELHHKPVNLQSIPGLIDKCRELGVFTHGTLVVGMPGETMQEIVDGFEYVKDELEFTSVSAFIAAAIPGSELYHQMLREGKVTREEARSIDTTKAKICLSHINPRELEALIDQFQTEYTDIVKVRDPEEYERKYHKLKATGRFDEAQLGGKLT
jgi:anaerobic magnesium-protoporphyrin IX monomethyl ester cyclase